MTQTQQIDLNWARQNIAGFAKYKADVEMTKAEEIKYKTKIGYVPNATPKWEDASHE